MLNCYIKEKNGLIYIYEKGVTYKGMIKVKVDRMFKAIDFKPLTFPNNVLALQFCISRNSIMRL